MKPETEGDALREEREFSFTVPLDDGSGSVFVPGVLGSAAEEYMRLLKRPRNPEHFPSLQPQPDRHDCL